jgi:hypothetical protein
MLSINLLIKTKQEYLEMEWLLPKEKNGNEEE